MKKIKNKSSHIPVLAENRYYNKNSTDIIIE